MKVAIHHNGKEGFIRYNRGNHEIMVTHPDEVVRQGVRKYLNTERPFDIAASSDTSKKGHKITQYVTPNESDWAMKMGLTEMHYHIGVHVNWGHKDNDLSGPTKVDPNAQADKPILKSVLGDIDFEIIN